MLSARETLFLRRKQDLAVLDQRRGAVVIKRGNAEHSHAGLEQCVDERRERAALSDHQECAHDRKHYDHRQEPEFLARTHKSPKFGYKIHIEVLELIFHRLGPWTGGLARYPVGGLSRIPLQSQNVPFE